MWICKRCGDGEIEMEVNATVPIDQYGDFDKDDIGAFGDFCYQCSCCSFNQDASITEIEDIAVWEE